MSSTPNRVVIERVQWLEVLPILRLASAFRHALQPGKVIVALFTLLILHGAGLALDALFGGSDKGIYKELVGMLAGSFHGLIDAVLSFNFSPDDPSSVLNILGRLALWLPTMLFEEAPWFTVLFGLFALVVLMLGAGVICRMSATQVCHGKLTSLPRATRFVTKRWLWYLLTPLLPIGLVVLLGLILMLVGLVFFNVPVLDVVGSAIYGLLLVVGFVIALVGLVMFFAVILMPSAMSVEGTDAFDAISRTFNYVMYKPWQYAGYFAGTLAYLAAVFLILSMLAGLTQSVTQWAVDAGAFTHVPEGAAYTNVEGVVLDKPSMTRYEAISSQGDIQDAGAMVQTSSWLVARWIDLLGALVIALMFSTFCSLQTQVYVLLRRAADDTPLDDCAADDESELWSSPADMVDPTAQAIVATGPKGHPKPDAPETDDESATTAGGSPSVKPEEKTEG